MENKLLLKINKWRNKRRWNKLVKYLESGKLTYQILDDLRFTFTENGITNPNSSYAIIDMSKQTGNNIFRLSIERERTTCTFDINEPGCYEFTDINDCVMFLFKEELRHLKINNLLNEM